MNCLPITDEIRQIAQDLNRESPEVVSNLVGLWQGEDPNKIGKYPSIPELLQFIAFTRGTAWHRMSQNNVEVSSAGYKQYSALTAKLAEGTKILGTDVGNMTIEEAYKKIKGSGKGQAPSNKSILNLEAQAKGTINMVFSYDDDARPGITAKSTFEAIEKGERTATTRYSALDFYKKLKVGDILAMRSKQGKILYVRITKTLTKLEENHSAEEWSQKEGWSEAHYYKSVYPKIKTGQAHQIEYEYVASEDASSLEDYSFETVYLPLWREWAKQNPDLIQQLKEIAKGKILTDKFANTRVSQARALSIIVNELYTPQELEELKELQNNAHVLNKTEIEEGTPEGDMVNEDLFNISQPLSYEEMAKVDIEFNPIVRRDRVTLLARLFTNQVTQLLEMEKQKTIMNIADPNLTQVERMAVINRQSILSRMQIIREYGVARIYLMIKESILDPYLNISSEEQIELELNKLKTRLARSRKLNKYTEEQLKTAATKNAQYRALEYQKIVNNYKALCAETAAELQFRENIKLLLDANEILDESELPYSDNGQGENIDSIENKEVSVKDGWVMQFREVSAAESLCVEVRKFLNNIPKLNSKGKYETDDLGQQRYYDPEYTHAALLDALRYMVTSEDVIPILTKLKKSKPWVGQIIKTLKEDEILFTKFYSDMRREFTSYWIQKSELTSDGLHRAKTIQINQPQGTYYLLDSWRDNYQTGTVLSEENSVYGTNSSINFSNAGKNLKRVEALQNALNKEVTEEDKINYLLQDKIFKEIVDLLKSLGIDPNIDTLKTALETRTIEEEGSSTEAVFDDFLTNLNVIFKGIKDGKNINVNKEDQDLINIFGSAYNNIAKILNEVQSDAIESYVRQGDKGYYAFTNPSYAMTMIKQLKNVGGSKKRFAEFMKKEFKQYEWFYKNNTWRNYILEKLEKEESSRNLLNYKVVLQSDKKDYKDWDPLTYTKVMINEYLSDPNRDTAWYHMFMLADAPSAEFFKFHRITNNNITQYDDNGNKLNFQQVIIEHLVNLVNQEYDRIQLVRARHQKYLENKKKIEKGETIEDRIDLIQSFDISEDGSNIGAAEFKFLPTLNDYTIEGKKFLDVLESKIKNGDTDIKEFITSTLSDVMEEEFEKTYQEWHKLGLLDLAEKGNYLHIPFYRQTEKNENLLKIVATILKENQKGHFLTDNEVKNLEIITNRIANNLYYKDKDALKIFNRVKSKVAGLNNTKFFDTVDRHLNLTNVAKHTLREYFYNSTLASASMLQIMTTDIGYYKNVEDLQKRYKEVHSPTKRLNTKATFHGELIGKDYEKSLILKDSEIISNVIKDLEDLMVAKYKAGELSEYTAVDILTKFGATNTIINGKEYYKLGETIMKSKKINVTDAQAFRTLDSYRAIKGMLGEWTDEMEEAMTHLKNGEFSEKYFNIIWQTIKPFVYSQVTNDSGIQGKKGNILMKTPVQHKNSEFLLLAVYDLIAGPLGSSSKLKAINQFMIDNNIDKVQFESAVKVGGQAAVDLSTVNSYKDVYNALSEAIKDPNTITTVNYLDYGIATATPEHGTDHIQLIGTQIRKLITADMSDNIKITIDGKTFTKKQWLDLYNELNTENIIQSFMRISERFSSAKNIEELLVNEINNNPRYSKDLIKAIKIDPSTGLFSIPLFDPVTSNMVQQLLNSIIKKEVTKQEIKGGSLIQVTSYGLSDELKLVFEGKGKNKRLVGMECYMPCTSRKLFAPLMDKDGKLDINKLPEDLRKAIGYRVPTEDKYSMIPLIIKGFLPQQNGSAIMLPAEITTITGSDFDKYQC